MISFTYKDSNHIILVQPDVKEKMILNTISFIKDNDLEKRKMYNTS